MIVNIIGFLTVVYIGLLFFMLLLGKCLKKHGIKTSMDIITTESNSVYLIPTIEVNKTGRYFEISFYIFNICFYVIYNYIDNIEDI